MKALERVERFLAALEKIVVVVALMATFVAVVLQVIVRFGDIGWIPDTADLSLVGVAVLTFICIGLLSYTHGHITIEITDLLGSRRLRYAARSLAALGAIVFVVVYGVQALDLFRFVLASGEQTVQMGIPLWIPYASLVAGLVLCLFHTVMHWVRDTRAIRFGVPEEHPAGARSEEGVAS